jgi:tetratricopeptide (TPR) repeat protein
MTLKEKLVALMESIDAEEQVLFGNLSEEERSVEGKADAWSPKDVVAHLAAWAERAAGNLEAAARGEPLVRYDDYEELNARDFELYRDLPWGEVLEKAEAANMLLIEQIELRSDAELMAALTEERTVWRSIVGTGYTHPVIHLGGIYLSLGDAEYATGLQEEGAAVLLDLDDSAEWQGTVRYNLACHYSLMGDVERAISGLKEALELNPGLTEWSKEDPDFHCIREEPGYLALYEGEHRVPRKDEG